MFDRQTSSTVCAACANLIVPEGARSRWYRWQCHAWPREPVWNAVTGQHDKEEPYYFCKDRNSGDCAKYEPGPNTIRPRATTDGEIAA